MLTTLLIGDEVHGLGSEGFVSKPPELFDYRLGLSATPVRQYDDEGTEALSRLTSVRSRISSHLSRQ